MVLPPHLICHLYGLIKFKNWVTSFVTFEILSTWVGFSWMTKELSLGQEFNVTAGHIYGFISYNKTILITFCFQMKAGWYILSWCLDGGYC